MKNKYNEIKKIIEDEILWCEKNRGMESETYENAFIAGLKQVLFFIHSIEQEQNRLHPIEIKIRKVFIAAETFTQARKFAENWKPYIPSNWSFLDNKERLRGLTDVVVYFIDGWSKHPKQKEIIDEVQHMIFLNRAEPRYEQDLQKEQARENLSG